MFSLNVIDTDRFLEMPITSRLLYYELGMRADDDGFVDNWKKILMFTGLKEDDLKILIAKSFIIPFESGVIVIRHWRMNNYLQNDRIKPTVYQAEKQLLSVDESNVYNLYTECIHSIDKNSIDKYNINNTLSEAETSTSDIVKDNKHKYGEFKHVMLKDEELKKLQQEYENWEELIKYLDEYIEMKGYKAKSHYLAIKKWVVDAVNKKPRANNIILKHKQYTQTNDIDYNQFYDIQ